MKNVNLSIGILAVIVFTLTGQYMRFHYQMTEIDTGLRLLLRSRHIYILLAALVNVGIGLYCVYRVSGWRRWLQFAGSALIAVSPMLLIAAFFYEPAVQKLGSPLSRFGLFTVFGGVMLHLVSGWKESRAIDAK